MKALKIPATGNLVGRAIIQWVGKTSDSKPPDRVRLRLFHRFEGKDAITGLPLVKGWHVDHKIPLRDWIKTPEAPHGNRESNMQPTNAGENTKKAAQENRARKKVTAIQKKHLNVKQPSKYPIPSRPKSAPVVHTGSKIENAHRATMAAKGKRIPPRRFP